MPVPVVMRQQRRRGLSGTWMQECARGSFVQGTESGGLVELDEYVCGPRFLQAVGRYIVLRGQCSCILGAVTSAPWRPVL